MLVHKEDKYVPGFPRFVLKVNYSSKSKKFSIPLPDFMASVLEKKELGADTQQKVEQLFEDAVEKVKKAKTTVGKVIAYKIDSQRPGEISVRAAVANQMTADVGGRPSVSYEYLPSTLQNEMPAYTHMRWDTVLYSEEFEALFRGLMDDVNNIIKKLEALGTWMKPSRYNSDRTFTFLVGPPEPSTKQ